MKRLEALFADESSLRSALHRLRSENSGERLRLELRSSWPLAEDLAHAAGGHASGPPWVLIAAICGALLGGITAFAIGAGTALAYPLPTGGMEIVAGPPLGIVTYEGTALGLILATVLAVAWRARLYRPASRTSFDRELAEGKLLLTVFEPAESAEATLREAGALDLHVIG